MRAPPFGNKPYQALPQWIVLEFGKDWWKLDRCCCPRAERQLCPNKCEWKIGSAKTGKWLDCDCRVDICSTCWPARMAYILSSCTVYAVGIYSHRAQYMNAVGVEHEPPIASAQTDARVEKILARRTASSAGPSLGPAAVSRRRPQIQPPCEYEYEVQLVGHAGTAWVGRAELARMPCTRAGERPSSGCRQLLAEFDAFLERSASGLPPCGAMAERVRRCWGVDATSDATLDAPSDASSDAPVVARQSTFSSCAYVQRVFGDDDLLALIWARRPRVAGHGRSGCARPTRAVASR